jgi:recombination protein RecA
MKDFLQDFKKSIKDIADTEGSEPPRYWYSTGNYVLNKIISNDFTKGIPQGRLTSLSGPSGAGKSFLACNIMREAQKSGAYVLVLDSENALDNDFVTKIGVDTNKDYMHISVETIPQVQNVVSKFITGYKNNKEDMQVLIVIDSLDMLMTETEEENFEKGVTKGDQGQRNKQMKAMLRQFVQAIKGTNISMVCTNQVYKNQDQMNGEGVWIISDAVKYSLSQIILLTKLKLRGETVGEVDGIRMKCEGAKSRFSKPFQTVVIEVPYETGMNKNSGLLEMAVSLGIVEKAGARYKMAGAEKSWYAKEIDNYSEDILVKATMLQDVKIKVDEALDVETVEDTSEILTPTQTKQRRAAKVG